MQIKYLSAIVIALLFVTTAVQAQKQGPRRETQIITFDTKNYSPRETEDDETGKNSLTIGMLSWLNGYVPVYYERTLTSFLSLQVGGGATMRSYGNDFGQIVHGDEGESEYFGYGSEYSNVTDKYESYKYRKSNLGYYLSASPRIYFNENVLDGFFLGPVIEYKKFNYATQRVNELTTDMSALDESEVPRNGVKFDETMKCLDFTLNIGGHFQSENHMVVAWNFGFGVRNLSATRLDIGYANDGNGNFVYTDAVRDYSKVRPLLTFDFRIGGWF